jgi:predicted nucleotidyltransferase
MEEPAVVRDETIQEIARRLVDWYHPVRVYLFGSAARGDGGPDSGLDFCVVVGEDAPDQILRPGARRQAVRGIRAAKDIVPWRKTDFEQSAAWVKASLPATIVREGRVLYKSE